MSSNDSRDGLTFRKQQLPVLTGASYTSWTNKLQDSIFLWAHISGGVDSIDELVMLDLQYFVEAKTGVTVAVRALAAEFLRLDFISGPTASTTTTTTSTTTTTTTTATAPGPEPVNTVVKSPRVTGTGSTQANIDNEAKYEQEMDVFRESHALWRIASAIYQLQISSPAGPGALPILHGVLVRSLDSVDRNARFTAWVQTCYQLALQIGAGFNPWVYKVWAAVKDSLSDEMRAQVSAIRSGDLITLLGQLRLAVNRVEDIQPQVLKKQMWASKMEREGKQDLLTYVTFLLTNRDRLVAAKSPISDSDLQGMLVQGLDDDIFADVHDWHEEGLQPSFDALCTKVQKFATRTKVAAKLASLKHKPESVFATTQESKMVPIDAVMAALKSIGYQKQGATGSPKKSPKKGGAPKDSKKQPCYKFAENKCLLGDQCRFGHFTPSQLEAISASGSCRIHGQGHSDGECRSQQKGAKGAPGGPDESAVNRLLLTLLGGPHEFTLSFLHYCSAAMRAHPEYKSMILVDNCASVNCCSDITRAIPGSIVEVSGEVKGMGSVKITHAFDMFVDDFVDPASPDGPPLRFRARHVQHTPDLAFLAIFCEAFLIDAECDVTTKRVGPKAVYTPEGKVSRHAISEKRFEKDGRHIVTARTDPDMGLCVAVRRASPPAPKIALPALFDDSLLQSGNLDATPVIGRPDIAARLPGPQARGPQGAPTPPIADSSEEVVLPKSASLGIQKAVEALTTLHSRLNHAAGFGTCAKLLHVAKPESLKCIPCGMGNPRRTPHDTSAAYTPVFRSEAFSSDWVPVSLESYEGYTGYFIITDLKTHHVWTIPSEGQHSWCQIWQNFVAMVEAHERSTRVVRIHISDQAMCFEKCGRCAKFNADKGIRLIFSARENQWMNRAEGAGRHPKKIAAVLMISGGMDVTYPKLWPEAVLAATQAVNHLPSGASTLAETRGPSRHDEWHGVVTPIEAWLLRSYPFGCLMLTLKDKTERQQAGFGSKVDVTVFLWHNELMKSHRCLNLETKKIVHRSPNECTVYPHVFPLRHNSTLSELLGQKVPRSLAPGGAVVPVPLAVSQDIVGGAAPPQRRSARGWQPSQQALQNFAQVVVDDVGLPMACPPIPVMPDDPSLEPRLQHVFTLVADMSCTVVNEDFLTPEELQAKTPKDLWEALSTQEGDQWRENCVKHYNMLKSTQCFGPATATRPIGVRVFDVPLLCKVKTSTERVFAGAIPSSILKVRALVRGDRFERGVHFSKEETSSQQSRIESIKVLLAYAVRTGYVPVSIDIKDAYYGTRFFPRGVWVKAPPGYDPDSEKLRPRDAPPLFMEMLGTLPGCPQGGRLFEKRFIGAIKAAGWTSDPSDERIFKKRAPNRPYADYFGVHVDDLGMVTDISLEAVRLLVGNSSEGIGKEFPNVSVEMMRDFLGMQVEVEYTSRSRSIFISHKRLLKDFLEKSGYNAKAIAHTPLVPGLKISKRDCATPEEARRLAKAGKSTSRYQSELMVVGFAACGTRLDAKLGLRDLASVMNAPGEKHFAALDHFIRWIRGTVEHGIEFVHTPDAPPGTSVESYSDSSHGDCPDTCASTQGYITYLNKAQISAQSKVSKAAYGAVNLSEHGAFHNSVHTAKDNDPEASDFMALCMAAKTAIWLAKFAKWVFDFEDTKIKSFVDNTGVLALLRGIGNPNWDANRQALHKIFESKGYLNELGILCEKVDTADNPANPLTKQIASKEESKKELLRLAAPRGKSPYHTYGGNTKYAASDLVVYSNMGPPKAVVLLATKDAPLCDFSMGAPPAIEGTVFLAFPMVFVQDAVPIAPDESKEILKGVQQLIDARSNESPFDGNSLLDEITEFIARGRVGYAVGERFGWLPGASPLESALTQYARVEAALTGERKLLLELPPLDKNHDHNALVGGRDQGGERELPPGTVEDLLPAMSDLLPPNGHHAALAPLTFSGYPEKWQSVFCYEDVFPLRRGVGSRETPGASPHAPRQVSEGPVLPHLIAKGAAQPDPTQEGDSAASDSDEPPPLIEYDPEIDSWTDVEKILNRAEAQLRRDHLALGALILASQSQDEKEDAKACYRIKKWKIARLIVTTFQCVSASFSLQGTGDNGACPQGEIPEARRAPVDAECSQGASGRPGDRAYGTPFDALKF